MSPKVRTVAGRSTAGGSPSRGLAVVCLLTVYLAWGGTYPAIRVMVETVPPLLGTAVRFLVAGAVLAAVLAALGRLKAGRRKLAGASAVGIVILGDIGVLAVAELLVDPGRRGSGRVALVLVAAAAVEAAGQFWSQSTPLPEDPLVNSTVQLPAAGAALALAGLVFGEANQLDAAAFSTDSLLAFAYLVVPGSIVAYTAFTRLLRNVPITTVSTYAYVNPVWPSRSAEPS